jgi:MOSC domain-containing protein YiiM
MTEAVNLTMPELEAGMAEIRRSPRNEGTVTMIVRRPRTGEREIVSAAELDFEEGLVGDNWKARAMANAPDREPNRNVQLTLMNSRVIALLAREKARWPLAGDQLYLDLDLSMENLPAGAQVAIGPAIIQISAEPHTGCKKFLARFGPEAVDFVNSTDGKQMRLRGLNARIIQPGAVRVGDVVKILPRQ